METRKANGWTLIPFIVMMALFLCGFPMVTACLCAVALTFAFAKGKMSERFSVFAKGAGDEGVLIMLMIFSLSGAFSSVAKAMGGRDAVVNLGLSLVPTQFLLGGVFIIAMLMSTACGTSMGTIAAARGQNVEMKDKFRLNFLIALPAAIITLVLLCILGRPDTALDMGELSYSLVKVIPYVVVLALALIGMDVMLVMALGIASAALLGVFAVISVFVPFADSACRKDPWNWEYDCPESKVAEKKANMAAAGQ